MLLESLFVIIAYVISFGVTFFLTPQWITYARKIGLLGRDMHKVDETMVPEAGGIIVVCALIFSLFYYAGVQVIYWHDEPLMTIILGVIGTLLCVAIIGVMDDFRGWKIGLRQWQKPLLTLPAAVPFLLVTFPRTIIDMPFFGQVQIGVLFPLVLVPIAIVGASNAFNMLAGYNGIETGLGIILLGTLAFLAFMNGHHVGAVLCLIGFFALCAFLIFNWFPAKIFPGDTMTYSLGAYIAICAMMGHTEKYALILFIPYYLDFLLPLRKRMKVEAFARVNTDSSFETPYHEIYDLTHLAITVLKKVKHKVFERNVVLLILGVELVLSMASVLIYFFVPWF
jgi:UDP-N-acetylglucosamine--dolichyl-phosphate N-acetylglucosaminephosphotransferase